jgi:hypothetical protein
MSEKGRGETAKAVIVYTLLRILLFAAVWVVVELLTPIHGVWAAAAAIVMSGAISLILLDRQRGKVGQAAGGFFGRINQRIESSARAEDEALDAADAALAQREQDAQGQAVAEQQDPGALEGGDEGGTESATEDQAQGSDRQQAGQ